MKWDGWLDFGVRLCIKCGNVGAGLKHVLNDCEFWECEKERLSWDLRELWGPDRWYEWTKMKWNENMAVLLGLKGKMVKGHKDLVISFLTRIVKEEENSVEGANWGCARTRCNRVLVNESEFE